MEQCLGTITENRDMGGPYRRMTISLDQPIPEARPGQFVTLRLPDRATPLLRRPFSIHGQTCLGRRAHSLTVLFKVIGTATRAMAAQPIGTRIDLVGPLGRGFRIPETVRHVMLVAGGIGVAPLVLLAEVLAAQPAPPRLSAFLGGRTAGDLLCASDFRRLGARVVETTDDGSAGDQCLVTHPMEVIAAEDRPDVICACGPMPMLGCVCGIAERMGIACQVSLETLMACAVGVCLGCAVASRAGERYLHACRDGPVLDAAAIDWTAAAG